MIQGVVHGHTGTDKHIDHRVYETTDECLLAIFHEKLLHEILAVIRDVPEDLFGKVNVTTTYILHGLIIVLTTEWR